MSFVREYPVKAIRKRTRCDGCPKHIEIGEPAIRWAGTIDGDFQSAAYHPECRDAEIAYNRMAGNHTDDWSGLLNHEDDDRPWLIEEHPIVAARYGYETPAPSPGAARSAPSTSPTGGAAVIVGHGEGM